MLEHIKHIQRISCGENLETLFQRIITRKRFKKKDEVYLECNENTHDFHYSLAS